MTITDDDHERGCSGREYECTCGYDARVAAEIVWLEAEVAALTKIKEVEIASLKTKLERAEAALLPFALMAPYVEGKVSDGEPIFTQWRGPKQWVHIMAGDLRAAAAALTPEEKL